MFNAKAPPFLILKYRVTCSVVFQDQIYALGRYVQSITMYPTNYLEIFSNISFLTECKIWSPWDLSPNLKSTKDL